VNVVKYSPRLQATRRARKKKRFYPIANEAPQIVDKATDPSNRKQFQGALIYSGAARAVIVELQVQDLSKSVRTKFKRRPSNRRFRFGKVMVSSSDQVHLRTPVGESFIDLIADSVPLDVPLLLGLDTMKRYGMQICTKTGALRGDGWLVQVETCNGHLMLRWRSRRTELSLRYSSLISNMKGYEITP
jgi:hypothetical protein